MSGTTLLAGFRAALGAIAFLTATAAWAQGARELVEQSLRRHAPPAHVYQEQTLILSDPLGKHTVRTLRYYARREASGDRRLAVLDQRDPEIDHLHVAVEAEHQVVGADVAMYETHQLAGVVAGFMRGVQSARGFADRAGGDPGR